MATQAQQLADAFRSGIRAELDEAQLLEVDRRNGGLRQRLLRAIPEVDTCATHDFCDANMIMEAAFKAVNKRPMDDSPADCKLWDDAWTLAKAAGFAVPAAEAPVLLVPTIHPTGTGREELVRLALDAQFALSEALGALRRMRPHGRDYYPQGDVAVQQARDKFDVLHAQVERVRAEVERYAIAVADAGQ